MKTTTKMEETYTWDDIVRLISCGILTQVPGYKKSYTQAEVIDLM